MSEATTRDHEALKSCRATLYGSDWARLLLGDAFHPGGLALTERLGTLLDLGPGVRLLDVAAGRGASALHLAERLGCTVVGVDLSAANVAAANQAAAARGLADRARFVAAIRECAFCTFPDKPAAAEFARALCPGGRLGLSDLTRRGEVRPALAGLLAWVASIADARPLEAYLGYLAAAGLVSGTVEAHDAALAGLVRGIRQKLLGAELLVALGKLSLPSGIDLATATAMGRAAAEAVAAGELGYAIIVATRAGSRS